MLWNDVMISIAINKINAFITELREKPEDSEGAWESKAFWDNVGRLLRDKG